MRKDFQLLASLAAFLLACGGRPISTRPLWNR